jgi:hypothetical protein
MLLQAVVSSKAFLLPFFFHLRAVAKALALPALETNEANTSEVLLDEQAVDEEHVFVALLQQLAESTGSLTAMPLASMRELAVRVAFAALTRSDMTTFDSVTRENGLVSLGLQHFHCPPYCS